MHNQLASFRAALDARPVSRYQWLILLLLALLLVTDGYDAQVLGYVVPALAQDWGLEKAAFGPVFSANLLGLTLGSLLVTPLADRFGVRRILLGCVLIYASLTVLMVFANSLTTLMAARFICGIGMGGAMPSAMALMSEYSPPRLRTLMVTLAACGFSFGGAAGGFVAAGFIEGFGWQAVFLAGGVTPLLLFPFLVWLLPESLPRLLRDAPPYARLQNVMSRMLPGWQPPLATEAENQQEQGSKLTVVELFRNGYARPTLLIWSTFFCQPDPAVFHDQLASVVTAGEWVGVERGQPGDLDVPVRRYFGCHRHGLVRRPLETQSAAVVRRTGRRSGVHASARPEP
jgi:AAHS family 4-hydroxybenzoate transporter-like MFS transporter